MSESPKLLDEVKTNDWFTRTLKPTLQEIVNHRFGVGGITLAVIAVVGAAMALNHWYSQRELRHFATLEAIEAKASDYLEQYRNLPHDQANAERNEKATKLTEELSQFRKEHAGSSAGAVASFYLGEVHYIDGKYTEAIEAYRQYLNKLPHGHGFRAVILSSIGYAYEALEKYQEAAESFLQAAEVAESPTRDADYLNSARAFERAGVVSAAKANYQKVVDEFPSSTALNLAKSKLSQLADKS